MKCFFVCSLTLLLVSMTARAELYLVVGSYAKAASATSEAARLSGLLGVDVTTHATVVDGVTYQRVLLRAVSTNSEVDRLLAQQGISPWRFNLDTDANAATATASMESDTKQYDLKISVIFLIYFHNLKHKFFDHLGLCNFYRSFHMWYDYLNFYLLIHINIINFWAVNGILPKSFKI